MFTFDTLILKNYELCRQFLFVSWYITGTFPGISHVLYKDLLNKIMKTVVKTAAYLKILKIFWY